MSRIKKRKNKNKKKVKKLLVLVIISIVCFSSLIIYGESYFYTIKTYLYKDKSLDINVHIDKNDDLSNMNLNFVNRGSCDVYLRGFVFVYFQNTKNTSTTISNSSVKINYGDEKVWFIGEDNYVYYTKPLKVGDKTQIPMVKSIDINLSEEDKKRLEEDELRVDIVMEAIQVNNFAYKYEWDLSDIDLRNLFNNSDKSDVTENKDVIKVIFK